MKNKKSKHLTQLDYIQSIRKPLPPSTKRFKDRRERLKEIQRKLDEKAERGY